MKRKVIGIDLDEVLRSYKSHLVYYYHKANNLKIENIDYESFNDKSFDEILDFKEENITTFYIDNDIDVAYATRNKITKEEKTVTKNDKIYEFLYVDYLLELYGMTKKIHMNIGVDLNKLISKYSEKYKFIILFKDKLITFAPTLLFLANIRPMVSEVKLVDNDLDLTENCDIYITANENYLKVFNKENIILVNNSDKIKHNKKINKLSDLIDSKILD